MRIEEELKHDETSKVLVVGGRASNFPNKVRENSRVIWWDSYDNQWHRTNSLPPGVRYVLLTRFLRHTDKNKVKSMCGPGVKLMDGKGTGQLTKVLQFLEKKERVEAMVEVMNGQKVSLSEFLRTHADLHNPDLRKQVTGLMPQIRAAGYETTEKKAAALLAAIRSREGISTPRKKEEPEFTPAVPQVDVKVEVQRVLEQTLPLTPVEYKEVKRVAEVLPPAPVEVSLPATVRTISTLAEFRGHLRSMRERMTAVADRARKSEEEFKRLAEDSEMVRDLADVVEAECEQMEAEFTLLQTQVKRERALRRIEDKGSQ